MTMQSDLRSCLLSLVDERVYFAVLPFESFRDDVWPCIVITADMATADPALGYTEDDHRMQIDIYARSIGSVLTLRPQVFAAIEGQFPHATRISDMADYDPDTKLHRRTVEYTIPTFV